jgi:hypothetical protein
MNSKQGKEEKKVQGNAEPTYTLEILAYLNRFEKQSGMNYSQIKEVLQGHSELDPWRKEDALKWAENALPGERMRTYTDLEESDQADVFLWRE